MVSPNYYVPPATMTDGSEYTGHQQFKGAGQQRYCAKCREHMPYRDGSMQRVMGGMHWVCAKHPKVAKNA